MKKRGLLTLLGSVCLILVLAALPFMAACAAPTPPEEKPLVLRMGWPGSPQAGMNPFLAATRDDYMFLALMYEPLCMPMMDGPIKPWIAKSWEYKAEEDTWIFHLDEKAKWSDGEPLTADDVKFTFETAYKYDFRIASQTKAFVESIQAIDEHTVSFKMTQPFAAFLYMAGSTLIMPKHIWAKVDKVDLYENPSPVGSGPFLFKEFKARAFLHLVKDEHYWRGPANIDEIVIQIYSNPEAEVVALKKGELDIVPDLSGQESLIPPLLEDPNVKVLVDRWAQMMIIAPNYRIYPLNLKEFREAIDLAVDKKAIIDAALAGYGELPLMGYIPPIVSKWANTEVTWHGLGMTHDERISEANAILDELGFKRGKDGIRVTDKGEKTEFTLSCVTSPSDIRVSEIITENLQEIGIKLTVQVTDPETLIAGIIFSGERSYDWNLWLYTLTADPDPDLLVREYAPEPPTPWDNGTAFGFENEEIQSLLRQSRTEMDETKRWEMIQEAQKLFADELVVITLCHPFHSAAYRTDRFVGWNPEPINYVGMFQPLGSIQNIVSLHPK
jgi:peptide/nickel transport system substrate-binding protein